MTEISKTGTPTSANVQSGRRTLLPERWGVHLMLILSCLIIGFPLLYAMIVSTQNNTQVIDFRLLPGSSLSENLHSVWEDRELGRFMLNSSIQAVIITVGKTILSLLAGLAFVYFRFPGKWIVFGFVLITLMMPTEIMIIALFRLMADLQWGEMAQLTVPFLASATGTFLFRQHFANIPAELSEAAQLDGANPLQFLIRVLIPISWNTIGALAVIQFIYVWNMYAWPVLIQADVVQVGLGSLLNIQASTSYGPAMLGAVLASIPPVIVFVLLQKQFMSGFSITRDK